VYACEKSAAEALSSANVTVVTVPCVGMLPPAFIDFALSRDLSDGVMLAGCAKEACHYRLGNTWTQQRIDGERDPYLRKRVPRERLALSWLPNKHKQRQRALDEFVATLRELPPMDKRRRSERE
jgi:coenzyme F420-reducing hydrogenase delta subunit